MIFSLEREVNPNSKLAGRPIVHGHGVNLAVALPYDRYHCGSKNPPAVDNGYRDAEGQRVNVALVPWIHHLPVEGIADKLLLGTWISSYD